MRLDTPTAVRDRVKCAIHVITLCAACRVPLGECGGDGKGGGGGLWAKTFPAVSDSTKRQKYSFQMMLGLFRDLNQAYNCFCEGVHLYAVVKGICSQEYPIFFPSYRPLKKCGWIHPLA